MTTENTYKVVGWHYQNCKNCGIVFSKIVHYAGINQLEKCIDCDRDEKFQLCFECWAEKERRAFESTWGYNSSE